MERSRRSRPSRRTPSPSSSASRRPLPPLAAVGQHDDDAVLDPDWWPSILEATFASPSFRPCDGARHRRAGLPLRSRRPACGRRGHARGRGRRGVPGVRTPPGWQPTGRICRLRGSPGRSRHQPAVTHPPWGGQCACRASRHTDATAPRRSGPSLGKRITRRS
jgi:hypothetical protein